MGMKSAFLALLVLVSSQAFGEWDYNVIDVASVVRGADNREKTPVPPPQLAYGVDEDGTKLVKEVPGYIASGAKIWFKMPDGHRVLFGVP